MRYLLAAGLTSTNSLDYHVTPVSFRVGGCFSGGQDSWDLWVRRIQRAEHSVGGYAAGATGSGAWTGTWCVVLGCTPARRQPVPRIMSI